MVTHWIPDNDKTAIIEINAAGNKRFVRASQVHATVSDVVNENLRKNQVISDVIDELPARIGQEAEGEDTRFTWSINPTDRSVVITIVDSRIGPVRVAALRNRLETRFGTKVMVVDD